MMKKLLIVMVVLAVIVGAFAGYVATLPGEFHIERKTTINAPASEVFAQVNDFHHWDKWCPWMHIDRDAKTTYEGPTAGKGAIYRWVGNSEAGEGGMTILESRPNELIKINLEFLKPMKGTATADFTFKEEEGKTVVTWSMDGNNSFIAKAFCTVMRMDMENMIGAKHEEGLANMKKIVEGKK